jgi:hypothetical protein
VWSVWNACCPRSGTQSVPSHVHAPNQSGLFPQIFCPLCATTSAAVIGQLDVGIKQSLEGKWRNVRRGCVPLAHSRRSLTQAKFLPQRHTVATPFSSSRLRMDLFTYHATPPEKSTGQRRRYPPAQANLTKIDQAFASWGKKGSILRYAYGSYQSGAPDKGTHSLLKAIDGLFFDAHAMPPATGSTSKDKH